VLEEQGYITIGDKGIVYHSDYVSSQLDQLEMKKMGAEATYGALIFQGLAAVAEAPEVMGVAGNELSKKMKSVLRKEGSIDKKEGRIIKEK